MNTTFIAGDLNARIVTKMDGEEQQIGDRMFDQNNTSIETQSEEVKDNRERLMEFCGSQDLRIMNSMFYKQDKFKITYLEKKKTHGRTTILKTNL